ncbi:MAG: hypothetical protein GTO46_02380 [Gemmatimonadetes bacterium]|nr:hypothetical protein [Gemmatimonadota bacterium]NIO30634.1 hypothetical protein [Gemmatimonadota bacterium]
MGRVLLWLLFLIIGLALGYWYATSCAPPPPTRVAGVEVVVGVTGDTAPFSIIPDPVTTRRGDTIRWVHPTADSLIIDLRGDPLGLPTADSLLSVAAGDTASTTIRLDAPFGTYKYSVTVRVGAQRDTEDPHIIVEEEG